MAFIKKNDDTIEKLRILANDSKYDLACACATRADEHRRRSASNQWIYPVIIPGGGRTYLFKTLLSNKCVNDCIYCPLRAVSNTVRCSLTPEALAKAFLSYVALGKVSGLFLSSAVDAGPDASMERINRTALLLRRQQFRGYIHLKIIPGASEAAIRQSLALASAVSLNIEAPGENNFKRLCTSKDYTRDVLRPIRLISSLTAPGTGLQRVKHTTQFVVGAAQETDREIIDYSWKLYKEMQLDRVYFSAYQRVGGLEAQEDSRPGNGDLLTREHRLYQVDFLIRKYGFKAQEIPLDAHGNLSLKVDPKEAWARKHPEFFPVNVNTADKFRLLRVPGVGQVLADRIIQLRQNTKIRAMRDIGPASKLLQKAGNYIVF